MQTFPRLQFTNSGKFDRFSAFSAAVPGLFPPHCAQKKVRPAGRTFF